MKTDPTDLVSHQKGLRAARARSEWLIGDPGWAEDIIYAYLYPEEDSAALNEEMSE